MSEALIELADVHLSLPAQAGDVNILRGISLNIGRGERVAILGPSGSGKSTLLSVLAGLEVATSGKVHVAGRDLTVMSEDALATFRQDHISIVFQAFHLLPTMTALENVAAPLELAGRPRPFDRAAEALARVKLADRATHYPAQLSGGEQQRVALARAMVMEPDLILADEPTGNLDGATGQAVAELLLDGHQDRGTTLVLITHDEELAARCDRIVRIADGLIVSDTPAGIAAGTGEAEPALAAG